MEDKKQPFMLLPTIQSRIIAGIITFTGIMIVVFWIAVNEPARMEEFTDRSAGRRIENGAILFESNCAPCHGNQGFGTAGVAPALNNPQFFGVNYFENDDLALAGLEEEITAAADDDEAARDLQLELMQLQTERQMKLDALVYDYQATLDELEANLAEVESGIETDLGLEPDQVSLEVQNLTSEVDAYELELEGTEDAPGLVQQIEEAEANGDVVDELITRRDFIETELARLDELITPLRSVDRTRSQLQDILEQFRALMEPHNEIMALYQQQLDAIAAATESDQTIENLENDLAALEQQIATLEAERQTAFDELTSAGTIVAYNPSRPARIDELAWAGGLHDLVFTTIVGGRPTSSSYWPNAMAAWSQTAGGPLRDDQIESLTDYILNWEDNWTSENFDQVVADVRKINQFAIVPQAPSAGGDQTVDSDVDPALLEPVGTDVEAILTTLETVEGDSQAGQQLFQTGPYGCGGCHIIGGGGAGPDPTGVAVRAQGHADESEEITSARYYLVQSIVQPNAFVAEGYQPNIMPQDFATRINFVDLANIIAYLESFDVE